VGVCDTAVVLKEGRVLFAKNSDRDPNEAQLLDWRPAGRHEPEARVRCTWIDIPQARETHAVLLSRPFWMWGAEMGSNQHGVVIGNEAVFTTEPYADTGLTGMDLLRLALERSATAAEAVETITRLLEIHGQGGGCGHENRLFTYHNSFIVADPGGAFVVETAGRRWVAGPVNGVRTISNALSIEPFASRYATSIKTRVAAAHRRQACTERRARKAESPADMMALLRDHGAEGDSPAYSWINGGMGLPCVHAGGILASSQTTGSWVAELSALGVQHWVTGTAAPCTGLFKPVRVEEPLDLGPAPTDQADDASLWWRHEHLHRRVVADPARLLPLYREERDAVEKAWLADPPDPASAFAEAERLLEDWEHRVARKAAADTRPRFVRRYWKKRNQRAGLLLD
jgi:dipeptidase